MFFWKRKKREQSFEKKMSELDSVILTEQDYRNTRKIEQYVVERLEQMIELAREIENEKSEYRIVTFYLNDVQLLEDMSEDERNRITEVAVNVVQLNTARTEFLNSAKKISDAQFAQMEQMEHEIPDAIRRLSSNEIYSDTLKKDMNYLEREKSEWVLRKEYLAHQQRGLKNLLYVMVGMAATAAVILGILQIILEYDFFCGWLALIFVAALTVCGIYLKLQDDLSEIQTAERNRNRAVILQNKIKLKYVNIANAVEYACEKYHVKSAEDLKQQWEYYMEAVKEREKYQRTNEDLEYFNGRLVRMLTQYHLYDAQVWVTQAIALVDPKEMVEVKHALVGRRQKLRGRIEYNIGIVQEQKRETEQLLDKVGDMRPQVQQILRAMDQVSESV